MAAAHRLAALWEPMSLGRPCDSAEAVRSFTKRGSAMDARLHTCVRTTAPAQDLLLPTDIATHRQHCVQCGQ